MIVEFASWGSDEDFEVLITLIIFSFHLYIVRLLITVLNGDYLRVIMIYLSNPESAGIITARTGNPFPS